MVCGWAVHPTPGSRCSALASSTSMRLAADPLLRQWRDRGTDRLSLRARDDGKSLALVPGIVLFCIPSHWFELVTCSAVRLADDAVPAFLGTLAGDLIWLESCSSYQPSLLFFSLLIPAVSIAADTKYGGFLVGKCV